MYATQSLHRAPQLRFRSICSIHVVQRLALHLFIGRADPAVNVQS